MSERVPLAIVGAGPAGLAAADVAGRAGVDVALIDEQPAVGGQIYRGIADAGSKVAKILGADYAHGRRLLGALNHPTVRHWDRTTVWEVTRDRRLFLSRHGKATMLSADHIILATGATERPMPFPGWTLPGVMTAGAAQILLKTAGVVPAGAVVLAGAGPLLLLVANQLLRAGVDLAAIVETAPRSARWRALRHLPAALAAPTYLAKGLSMLQAIRARRVPFHSAARALQAVGQDQVTALRFSTPTGVKEVACDTLLIHAGVVPNVQITRSLDLPHDWDALQRCWRPRVADTGATDLSGIAVAGDGGGIGGARAAEHQGRIAGYQVAFELGAMVGGDAAAEIEAEQRRCRRHLAIRPFLDTLYGPGPELLCPPDDAIVCRCETVMAAEIRGFARLGCLGPNQTKAFSRCGMGPCQGRMCGLTVSELIAETHGMAVEEVGYYGLRPPIKPVTLGEVASLHQAGDAA